MSFRSIRLIFNTRSSLDLLFNEREISIQVYTCLCTVCYCPMHLKYEELRRNIVHYLRKEICFSEYIYIYIRDEAADMQLKSAASGPVSRQGWTTLWKEGAFILRKEIYGTRVVCHQRVGGCILFLRVYTRCSTVILIWGETCVSRRDVQIPPINLIYTKILLIVLSTNSEILETFVIVEKIEIIIH